MGIALTTISSVFWIFVLGGLCLGLIHLSNILVEKMKEEINKKY